MSSSNQKDPSSTNTDVLTITHLKEVKSILCFGPRVARTEVDPEFVNKGSIALHPEWP
uniref:Uncharacterized protein n=1 Tax=Moniliophthora roreri TaxID=221103 RepID=A0A0W0FIL4_MONRR